MPFCTRCAAPPCDAAGIISVNWSTSATSQELDMDCEGSRGDPNAFILGAVQGQVQITAYAFEKGAKEAFFGTSCAGRVQAAQQNIVKYDGRTCKSYLIPTTTHQAQITGDIPAGIASMEVVRFTAQGSQSQILSGGAILTTLMDTDIGAKLRYGGPPMGIEVPTLGYFSIFGKIGCFSALSVEVDYPSVPAQVSYTFEFIDEVR